MSDSVRRAARDTVFEAFLGLHRDLSLLRDVMAGSFTGGENIAEHRALDGNQNAFARRADRSGKIESVETEVIPFRDGYTRGIAAERIPNTRRDRAQQVVQIQVGGDVVVDFEDHFGDGVIYKARENQADLRAHQSEKANLFFGIGIRPAAGECDAAERAARSGQRYRADGLDASFDGRFLLRQIGRAHV